MNPACLCEKVCPHLTPVPGAESTSPWHSMALGINATALSTRHGQAHSCRLCFIAMLTNQQRQGQAELWCNCDMTHSHRKDPKLSAHHAPTLMCLQHSLSDVSHFSITWRRWVARQWNDTTKLTLPIGTQA